jgi:hypothetical protein
MTGPSVTQATVAPGHEPGDGGLGHRAVLAVTSGNGRVPPDRPGGDERGVVGPDAKGPGPGFGAARPRWAGGAVRGEAGRPPGGQGGQVPGRAGDGAGPVVDAEVVPAEATGDGGL